MAKTGFRSSGSKAKGNLKHFKVKQRFAKVPYQGTSYNVPLANYETANMATTGIIIHFDRLKDPTKQKAIKRALISASNKAKALSNDPSLTNAERREARDIWHLYYETAKEMVPKDSPLLDKNGLFRPKDWESLGVQKPLTKYQAEKFSEKEIFVKFAGHAKVPNPDVTEDRYEVIQIHRDPFRKVWVTSIQSATESMDKTGKYYISHNHDGDIIYRTGSMIANFRPGTTYVEVRSPSKKEARELARSFMKQNLWKLYRMD